ncbi:MAG: phosphoribosyltransferase family protein [Methanocellales archaeon]
MAARIIEEPAYRERVLIFRDRRHAGKLLAQKLKFIPKDRALVLAIPAGGVPVGCEVAMELGIPMNVIIVRKIQIPWDTEAGFGAITWDGEIVLNESLMKNLHLTKEMIERSIAKANISIQERLRKFRDRDFPDLNGKIAILIDDGLASGFTMLAAARSTRKRNPEKIIIAAPTGSSYAIKLLSPEVDEIVCLNIRSGAVFAVADAYQEWYDLSEEEVLEILKKYWRS